MSGLPNGSTSDTLHGMPEPRIECSLIVPIPAATAVVEPWRKQLDPFSPGARYTHFPLGPVAS
jgi:hypothetical protein